MPDRKPDECSKSLFYKPIIPIDSLNWNEWHNLLAVSEAARHLARTGNERKDVVMNDPLGDILRLVRLRSCVYFAREFRGAWGMAMGDGPFAQFHAVTRGNCIVEMDGAIHTISAGDILLFPHGAAHSLADREGRTPVPGPEVLSSFNGDAPYFSQGGTATQLVCGHYEYRTEALHPLIRQLPDMIHVRAFDTLSQGTVDSVLPLMVRELQAGAPGGEILVERLAEVLLIQILRAYLAQARVRTGVLAALADPRLARAIQRIHAASADKLTLQELARTAGMSRTAFAGYFKSRVGLAPMEYLTKWRMYRASEMLTEGILPLERIAHAVGYESAISFIRAFKREFQISPGRYRRTGKTPPPRDPGHVDFQGESP